MNIYIYIYMVIQAVGHIFIQLGQTEKALEFLKKATKFHPRDHEVVYFFSYSYCSMRFVSKVSWSYTRESSILLELAVKSFISFISLLIALHRHNHLYHLIGNKFCIMFCCNYLYHTC